MNEKEFEHLLEKWEIDLPDAPRFRSAVWREIAIRDASSPSNRVRSVLERLLTPRIAVPIAAAAVATVMVTATFHGDQSRRRAWNNLAAAYGSAIDPIAHSELLGTNPESKP